MKAKSRIRKEKLESSKRGTRLCQGFGVAGKAEKNGESRKAKGENGAGEEGIRVLGDRVLGARGERVLGDRLLVIGEGGRRMKVESGKAKVEKGG